MIKMVGKMFFTPLFLYFIDRTPVRRSVNTSILNLGPSHRIVNYEA